MKTKTLLMLLFATLIFASCDKYSLDGDWDPMEWKKTNYPTEKIDGVKYYTVAAEGGSYSFTCKNYKSFWIAEVRIQTIGYGTTDDKYYHCVDSYNFQELVNDSISVRIEGPTANIDIPENDTSCLRIFTVTLEAGDTFYGFKFLQPSE